LARLNLDSSGMTGGILTAQNLASAFGGTITAFMTNPILGAVQAGKKLFGLWAEGQRAEALLAAAAKNRGSAFVAAANAQASALQELTGVDDEAIKGGQAVLATFENIQGATFDRAIQSALDMGAVLGGDAASNARMLGRALNDPAEGLSVLSRMGVRFNDEQEKTIKNMAAMGDAAGAQDAILKKLEDRYGGAAAAIADSDGGLQKMLNTLGDLGEIVGGVIAPTLSAAFRILKPILEILQPIAEVVGKIVGFLSMPLVGLADLIGNLSPARSAAAAMPVTVQVRPEDSARRIADQIAPAVERGVQGGVYRVESTVRLAASRAAEDGYMWR
jgi:hypothetical protein